MWKAISFLQKHIVWSIPCFMALGILFGYFFDPSFLRTAIIPVTILMVYPMMVNLNLSSLFAIVNPRVLLVALGINFLIIPLVGFGIGKVFFPENPYMLLGLIIISLLPTSGMTISWTGLSGGDVSCAIKLTVTGLLLGALLTPVYLQVLMGKVIQIPLGEVVMKILYIVFIPLAAGQLTKYLLTRRYGIETYNQRFKDKFPRLSTLGVMGIVFIAMSLKSKAIIADPLTLLYIFIPLALFYGVVFSIVATAARYLFIAKDAVTLVCGTVMRNLSIALAVAMTVFGEKGADIALIIAMGYIIQVQSGAWFMKLNEKIFGPTAKTQEA